jgi:hypothetical protein
VQPKAAVEARSSLKRLSSVSESAENSAVRTRKFPKFCGPHPEIRPRGLTIGKDKPGIRGFQPSRVLDSAKLDDAEIDSLADAGGVGCA